MGIYYSMMNKNIELVCYKGLLVRKNRKDDRNMIKECRDVYRYFDFRAKDVVLDLGVNVGGFAAMAIDAGVKQYVGVEADPENAYIAEKNIASCVSRSAGSCKQTVLLVGAASASTAKTLTFAQTESGNSKCSGSIVLNKRNERFRTIRYKVKNYNLDELFATYKPSLVKMDIEGAEYPWFESNKGKFPRCVREIALDLHGEKGIHRFESEWLGEILKDFELVHAQANTAFEGNKKLRYAFPMLGIKGTGKVYAMDVFFRRRQKL